METEILKRLFKDTRHLGNDFQIRIRNQALHVGFGICQCSSKRGECFNNVNDAIRWLANEDVKRRPESEFAKWWNEKNEK